MSMSNMLLMALLEAADDKKKKAADTEPDADTTDADTTPDTDMDDVEPVDGKSDTNEGEGEDTDGDDTEGKDSETPDDESQTEDENQDDESGENEGDENQENTDGESGDDFSLDGDGDGEGEDDGPPPDGLVDPDDDGSGDMEDDDGETNVQTNILQLSQLDRNLIKRKCYNDFLDLRTSITSAKKIVDDYEASIEPELRSYTVEQLDLLYTSITDYITIKFPTINYEENLQNYLLFVKQLNELVDGLNPNSKKKKTPKTRGKSKKPDDE